MEKVFLRVYNNEIASMIEGGHLDEAVAHCKHILRTFPMHIETYRLLGNAFLKGRHFSDASDMFKRILMSVPDDFSSHVGMSIIRDDEGNLDDAIWHMERAFEIQPSNPAIQGELRSLYGRRDGVEPTKIRLSREALAMSFIPQLNATTALLNVLITLMIFFLYLLMQKKGAHPFILLALHALALTGFTFFWKNFGGMSGTVPSFYCVYVPFIIVCSHGLTRWIIISSMAVTLAIYFFFPELLSMKTPFEPNKINAMQKNIDYLVVAALIVVFTIYMKTKFVTYREGVSKKHLQLDQIASTLHEQNRELATRQEETRAINDNLEAIVDQRARQVEVKNLELAEYAFINAHMLRGPLCRMLGLISLMEKEPERYPTAQLDQIKKITQEIDHQIKEINSVVS